MADLVIFDPRTGAMRTLVDQGDNTYAPEVAVGGSVATVRASRVGLALVNAIGVGGAGLHAYGPFPAANGWVGGLFRLSLSVGASVTLAIYDPTGNAGLIVSGASPAAPGLCWCEIGPGVTTLAGVFARQGGHLPDGFLIVVNHSTAAAASYGINFWPGQ